MRDMRSSSSRGYLGSSRGSYPLGLLAIILVWLLPQAPAWASQDFTPLSFALPSQVKAKAAAIPKDQVPHSSGGLDFSGLRAVGGDSPGRSHRQNDPVAEPTVKPAQLSWAKSGAAKGVARDRQLFSGGADSLVAVAVGNAEGTRTPAGDRTPAYYGHRDPGNGQWNQGSFSYQHSAQSPSEADQRQLARLVVQTEDLRQQAQAKGLTLSLLEELNGIDLANQAPLAALDRGYIDWLAVAKQQQLPLHEAIVWARTWSYWDPDREQWNAPGLGNQWDSIYGDQERRHWAIVRAMENFGE